MAWLASQETPVSTQKLQDKTAAMKKISYLSKGQERHRPEVRARQDEGR